MMCLGSDYVLGIAQQATHPRIDFVLSKAVKRGLEIVQNDCVGEAKIGSSSVMCGISVSDNATYDLKMYPNFQ